MIMNHYEYPASLDKSSKNITIGVSLLFLFAVITSFTLYFTERQLSLLITPILLIVSYFLIFSLKPVSYRISGKSIVIHRLAFNKEIKRDDIEHISVVSKEEMKQSIRTFAVGGLFGYFGEFSNSKYGRMTWYVTRMDQLVLIVTTDKRHFLLSPNEPEQFVKSFLTDK